MPSSSFHRQVARAAGIGLCVATLTITAQSAAWATGDIPTPPPVPGAAPGAGEHEGSYVDQDGALLGAGTGGDVSVDAGPNSEQAVRKLELSRAYYAAKYGGASRTAFFDLEKKYAAQFPMAADADALTLPGAGLAAATERNLRAPSYPQQKDYYCGPASGMSLLKLKGPATSRKDGSSLTQAHLANGNHMRTEAHDATKWASKDWVNGINMWREGRATGHYVQVNSPDGVAFKKAAVHSIDNGMPFGADTVELAGGAHYNGHPNRTIGHWLLGYAYEGSGAKVYFTDSSTPYFPNAAPRFSSSSVSFANAWLQSNGIAY